MSIRRCKNSLLRLNWEPKEGELNGLNKRKHDFTSINTKKKKVTQDAALHRICK